MKEIIIHNKIFIPFINRKEIEKNVRRIAAEIYKKYKNITPIFIGVLNGGILFFSDILKNYPGKCEIGVIQLSSYNGIVSNNKVEILSDWKIDIYKRHIVIFEDIVDTGNTLKKIYEIANKKLVSSISIATLFLKPDIFKNALPIDFIGIQIPDKFIIGYGLDFNLLGRNYPDVYQLKD